MSVHIRALAAGSLRKVLPEMFRIAGITGEIEFGPSGVLAEKIMGGKKADLFVSASMNHSHSLVEKKVCRTPILFAMNELCLFGRRSAMEGREVLETMLDPKLRLGTSTPLDDPGGDYAFAVFDKAEGMVCGASKVLKQKALTLVGGKNSRIREGRESPVHVLFREAKVDLFLGYRTTALDLISSLDEMVMTTLPAPLQVKAEYGATVVRKSNEGKVALDLLMTPEARSVLPEYGFLNK